MRIFGRLRAVGGFPARVRMRRELARFLGATKDCRATQREVLRRLLALNADSHFSLEHRLGGVHNLAAFRKRLPISNFETFQPYIERLKDGDSRALLGSANRLLMFSLSSGTTAESKYIPITQQFLDDYRRGWQAWGIRTFDDHPRLHTQNIVQLSSDFDRFRTPAGVPCGNISGLVMAMQRPVVRRMYSVPGAISKILDAEAKQYTALRLAVADDNVGLVTTANPSTLIQLAKLADAEKERLIRDIADGTLSAKYAVEQKVRDKLRWSLSRRRPRRARQLERIAERTGHLYPRDYWPQISVLAVWCGGSAAAYLHSLRRYYGDAPIRDHGLHASEGRMTIPMVDGRSEGVLDVTTHFFEFIPENEASLRDPTVLEAHELREGQNYYILLTTSSGLYRYNICDVVRCVGFEATTPLLEFLHKGAHISNLTGEKISESQVVAAVGSCIERMHIHLEYFTVAPAWGEPPRYQLLMEERDEVSPAVGEKLLQAVDARLQEINCEYREKRQSGRLATMEWVRLPPGTWARFSRQRQSTLGGSVEQYKHPCLVPTLDFCEQFLCEYGQPRPPASHEDALAIANSLQ